MRITARIGFLVATAAALCAGGAIAAEIAYFPVPKGAQPHDVAADPAPGGKIYYTGQGNGTLGVLDPATGQVEEIRLGPDSAPHGVIIGPDGAPWITDGGQNGIVRVDPATKQVKLWKLPEETGYANLNTATFDRKGRIWFTGQNGVYGRLDPASGDMRAWKSPRGRGPYGIAATPSGDIYYASLAGNHIARVNTETGEATPIEPPTQKQGARRVWPDSQGRIWVSEWNSGHVSSFDPATGGWRTWKLPGDKPKTYSVWVDEKDKVWLTEWSANAIVRFDPATETFDSFPSDRPNGNVRQMLGRAGEAWGAESGTGRLVVIRWRAGE